MRRQQHGQVARPVGVKLTAEECDAIERAIDGHFLSGLAPADVVLRIAEQFDVSKITAQDKLSKYYERLGSVTFDPANLNRTRGEIIAGARAAVARNSQTGNEAERRLNESNLARWAGADTDRIEISGVGMSTEVRASRIAELLAKRSRTETDRIFDVSDIASDGDGSDD